MTLLSLFTPKPIIPEEVFDDSVHGTHGTYKKTLTALDLTSLGVGCIIGAGIFTLTGEVAHKIAGPAVVVSYLIAGVICALSALCYAELAAMIPISGSAYTYTYHTMGEFMAWLLGWDLILEYLVGAAAVAVGWSYYLEYFLFGVSGEQIVFNPDFVNAPVKWNETAGNFIITGHYFNLPAFLGTMILTLLLCLGIKEASNVIKIFVVVKIAVILMFIFGGIKYTNGENLTREFLPFGFQGAFQGAITVFFAYIGFDA
ncbi:hypothetical protein HDV05_007041, partial [Chytridiales sp. JEL 0842]